MIDLNNSTSTTALNGAGKPASGKPNKRSKIPYAGKEAKKLPVPGPKAPEASAADSFPSSYEYKGLQIVSRGFGDVAVFGAMAKAPWADCFIVQADGKDGRFNTTQAAATWIDANQGKIDDGMMIGVPLSLQHHNRKDRTLEQKAALKTAAETAGKPVDPTTEAIKGKTPKGAGTKPGTGKAQKPKKGKGATRVAAKAKKAASGPAKPEAAASEGEPRKGSKAEMVGNMLRQPNGCTAADVMKACGWPSVSMPAQAKAAGLKLRKEKVKGEPARYYGS